MVTTLGVIIIAISAIGLVLSIVLGRAQQKREFDDSTGPVTAKHPMLANPILIAYILFPVIIVVGAIILMSYS